MGQIIIWRMEIFLNKILISKRGQITIVHFFVFLLSIYVVAGRQGNEKNLTLNPIIRNEIYPCREQIY